MPHRRNVQPLAASHSELIIGSQLSTGSAVKWSFGRGSVIWRIWPAVLFHIAFAAVVVTMSIHWRGLLALPPVLLTVLGVVIGFVISYRAMTGYDRYWMGRSDWANIIRNSRAMGRVIWYHVPPYLTPDHSGGKEEMVIAMKEKRMALDLIEGFAVAVKHHLRGEVGFYYEDLYYLIEPLHEHRHTHVHPKPSKTPQNIHVHPSRKNIPSVEVEDMSNSAIPRSSSPEGLSDPVIPPVDAYGTFHASASTLSVNSGASNKHNKNRKRPQPQRSYTVDPHCDDEHERLLPTDELANAANDKVASDLIPFMSIFSRIGRLFRRKDKNVSDGLPTMWIPPELEDVIGGKRRPQIAGGGENVPLDILRVLSEWVSVLEARGTVPGGTLGSISGGISNFEETLSSLEKILTTPLPFGYATHIKHTVWIYLFFLPFQLVGEFGWSSIAGVGIAAFIYLGFLAAGEEIEQPFGYDENDLNLDLFTGRIIHDDIVALKKAQCLNAYHSHKSTTGTRSLSETVLEIKKRQDVVEYDVNGNGKVDDLDIGDDVFGIRD